MYSTFTHPSMNSQHKWSYGKKLENHRLTYDHQIENKYYFLTGAGLLSVRQLHFDTCERAASSVSIHAKHILQIHTVPTLDEPSYLTIDCGQYPFGIGLIITFFLRRLRDLHFTNGFFDIIQIE